MREIIKKSFLLGLGAATLTKSHAERIVKGLIRKNAVTAKEGREMLNKIKKEALKESGRIRKLAENEARRIRGKVMERFRSIDKELSSKGKETLKKIIKELSK